MGWINGHQHRGVFVETGDAGTHAGLGIQPGGGDEEGRRAAATFLTAPPDAYNVPIESHSCTLADPARHQPFPAEPLSCPPPLQSRCPRSFSAPLHPTREHALFAMYHREVSHYGHQRLLLSCPRHLGLLGMQTRQALVRTHTYPRFKSLAPTLVCHRHAKSFHRLNPELSAEAIRMGATRKWTRSATARMVLPKVLQASIASSA